MGMGSIFEHLAEIRTISWKPSFIVKPPLSLARLACKAANPDADRDANQPKLTGKQTDAPKAEDVPRVDFSKLQPSPPAEKAQPQKPQQPKPQLAMNMGDLTLGKPQESQNPQAAQQPRPRTVNEALARQSANCPPCKCRYSPVACKTGG